MIDWASVLAFEQNPLEMALRGTLVYWFIFLLFRFVLRRDAGALGIADILLLVLIADAAQNAMSADYRTLGDGLVLVGTIAAWSWLIDWASFRWAAFRHFAEPQPMVLVRRGRIIDANLKREMISNEELMALLREHGIEKLDQVKMARMESDGAISVIRERNNSPSDEHDDDDEDAAAASRANAGTVT